MKIKCEVCGKIRDIRGERAKIIKKCRFCFYESISKPLLKEEVQEDWRLYINFDTQINEITEKRVGKRVIKHHEWKVEVKCPDCEIIRRVGVRYLRQKSVKKSATLYCLRCKNRIIKGRSKNSDGYIWVNIRILPKEFQDMARQMKFRGKNMILEHRIVMAMKLGRPLRSDEVVRHMNGNKTDNRQENLELGSHSENMRDHSTSFLENKILRGFIRDLGYNPEEIILEKKKDVEIVKRKRSY